jgi:hypothetical protein
MHPIEIVFGSILGLTAHHCCLAAATVEGGVDDDFVPTCTVQQTLTRMFVTPS